MKQRWCESIWLNHLILHHWPPFLCHAFSDARCVHDMWHHMTWPPPFRRFICNGTCALRPSRSLTKMVMAVSPWMSSNSFSGWGELRSRANKCPTSEIRILTYFHKFLEEPAILSQVQYIVYVMHFIVHMCLKNKYIYIWVPDKSSEYTD